MFCKGDVLKADSSKIAVKKKKKKRRLIDTFKLNLMNYLNFFKIIHNVWISFDEFL